MTNPDLPVWLQIVGVAIAIAAAAIFLLCASLPWWLRANDNLDRGRSGDQSRLIPGATGFDSQARHQPSSTPAGRQATGETPPSFSCGRASNTTCRPAFSSTTEEPRP